MTTALPVRGVWAACPRQSQVAGPLSSRVFGWLIWVRRQAHVQVHAGCAAFPRDGSSWFNRSCAPTSPLCLPPQGRRNCRATAGPRRAGVQDGGKRRGLL
jgi:hypothetical protein